MYRHSTKYLLILQCFGEVTEKPITLPLVGARLALRKSGLRFAVDCLQAPRRLLPAVRR